MSVCPAASVIKIYGAIMRTNVDKLIWREKIVAVNVQMLELAQFMRFHIKGAGKVLNNFFLDDNIQLISAFLHLYSRFKSFFSYKKIKCKTNNLLMINNL